MGKVRTVEGPGPRAMSFKTQDNFPPDPFYFRYSHPLNKSRSLIPPLIFLCPLSRCGPEGRMDPEIDPIFIEHPQHRLRVLQLRLH